MKLINRVKRIFTIKSNNILKKMENSIEVLEYELVKSKENIDSLSEEISKIKAQKLVVEEDKIKAERYIERLQKALDKAVELNNNELGNEAIDLIEKNQEKVNLFDQNIMYFEEVIGKLNYQYEKLKEQYEEKSKKFETLKIKNNFAKTMENVNKELKKNYSGDEFDFSEFEKIEREIQEKLHYEQDRSEVLSMKESFEDKIDKLTKVDKFEEYKRKLFKRDE